MKCFAPFPLLGVSVLSLAAAPLAVAQSSLTVLDWEFNSVYSQVDLNHDGSLALADGAGNSIQPRSWSLGLGHNTLDLPAGWMVVDSDDAGEYTLLSNPNGGSLSSAVFITGIGLRPTILTQAGSQPSIMSGDGQVLFGGDAAFNSIFPYRWINGAPTPLSGQLPNVYISGLADCSSDGSMLVGNTQTGPFTWTPGAGMSMLNTAPHDPLDVRVSHVSSDGTTIVGTIADHLMGNSAPAMPFRWTAATGVQQIPGTLPSRFEVFVNQDGSVVAGSVNGFATPAWFWTPANGVQSLGAALTPTGDFDGWELLSISAMSKDGNAFLGRADSTTGFDVRYYLAHLTTPVASTIGESYCGVAGSGSSGVPAALFATGSEAVADNDITLRAHFIAPLQLGYFLNSMGQGQVAIPGAGSPLCVGGGQAIGRHNRSGEIGLSGMDGMLSLQLDLADLPSPSGSTTAQAGQTWHFQAWFREPGGAGNSNLTNAVAITLQ